MAKNHLGLALAAALVATPAFAGDNSSSTNGGGSTVMKTDGGNNGWGNGGNQQGQGQKQGQGQDQGQGQSQHSNNWNDNQSYAGAGASVNDNTKVYAPATANGTSTNLATVVNGGATNSSHCVDVDEKTKGKPYAGVQAFGFGVSGGGGNEGTLEQHPNAGCDSNAYNNDQTVERTRAQGNAVAAFVANPNTTPCPATVALQADGLDMSGAMNKLGVNLCAPPPPPPPLMMKPDRVVVRVHHRAADAGQGGSALLPPPPKGFHYDAKGHCVADAKGTPATP